MNEELLIKIMGTCAGLLFLSFIIMRLIMEIKLNRLHERANKLLVEKGYEKLKDR